MATGRLAQTLDIWRRLFESIRETIVLRIIVLIFTALIPLSDAKAGTITFTCIYEFYNDNKGGKHSIDNEFKLSFVIDEDNGKAYMVGNNGSNEVTPISGSDGISFIEVTDAGNVMTTSIVKSGATVHSRNTIMFGDIIASQYFGTCSVI